MHCEVGSSGMGQWGIPSDEEPIQGRNMLRAHEGCFCLLNTGNSTDFILRGGWEQLEVIGPSMRERKGWRRRRRVPVLRDMLRGAGRRFRGFGGR